MRNSDTSKRYALRALRALLGKTQHDVSVAARMTQGDVSKLEGRADTRLSTLARYAAALGGEVDLAVVIDGRRYRIELGGDSG